MPAPTKESALASSLRTIARDVRRTGRSIGLLAFLFYVVRRRTRVHVVLGRRSVDVVATFAPAMADVCAEKTAMHGYILQMHRVLGRQHAAPCRARTHDGRRPLAWFMPSM